MPSPSPSPSGPEFRKSSEIAIDGVQSSVHVVEVATELIPNKPNVQFINIHSRAGGSQ